MTNEQEAFYEGWGIFGGEGHFGRKSAQTEKFIIACFDFRKNVTQDQKNMNAERMRQYRKAEAPSVRKTRQDKDVKAQAIKRKSETIEQKQQRKQKDADYHFNNRDLVPSKRPYNEKERKYYDTHYNERSYDLHNDDKSIYKYFLKVSNEHLEDGDWIWIENQTINKDLLGSDFEKLSKKFAVIFSQLGLSKDYILHFVVNEEILTYVARGGLWIIGALGSLSNKCVWTNAKKAVKLDVSQVDLPKRVSSNILL